MPLPEFSSVLNLKPSKDRNFLRNKLQKLDIHTHNYIQKIIYHI